VADLATLGPAERAQVLAGLTAQFATAYLRVMSSRRSVFSFPRVRVLELLGSGGPAIMRDLAEALGATARNVTAIVDALEEAGLVLRAPHPTDRRATMVELTDRGRGELVAARCQALGKATSLFDALSLEEQERFAGLVARLLPACRP
jgi:DNA-binding MarR family transcriptional regulator